MKCFSNRLNVQMQQNENEMTQVDSIALIMNLMYINSCFNEGRTFYNVRRHYSERQFDALMLCLMNVLTFLTHSLRLWALYAFIFRAAKTCTVYSYTGIGITLQLCHIIVASHLATKLI